MHLWRAGTEAAVVGNVSPPASLVVKDNQREPGIRYSTPKLRKGIVPITSSWIDEDGEGQTQDFGELWVRIESEIAQSVALVLYAKAEDFPLKGALIEVGIALGMGKPVIVCLPFVQLDPRSCRPIGSWINHPRVELNNNIRDIMQRFYKR